MARPVIARSTSTIGSVLIAILLTISVTAPAAAQGQPAAPAPAQGQPAAPQIDRIDLVGLNTRQPSADSPTNQVQFQATVNYHLQSSDSGFVLLFLFENSASDSTQQSSSGIPVQRGNGQLVLDIDYALRPDVRTLTLVASLFRTETKMLAWVSTNPIDMAPWPGRVAFEKAIAARLDNDFTSAEQELSQAIDAAPDTGNYYYWRGDTRVRLNEYDDAIADFNRSIELMPQDRASRVGRGVAELWLGNAVSAIGDLSVAIDAGTSPDRITAWAHRARGLAHASLGETTDAVADYQAYLDLAPDAADRDQVAGWIAALS
jgi:tetratricopeptide (TPR) repeat protein